MKLYISFFFRMPTKCPFLIQYSFNFSYLTKPFYTHRNAFVSSLLKKKKSNKSVRRIIFCIFRIQSFSVCCLFPVENVAQKWKRGRKKNFICLHLAKCFGEKDLLCFVYRLKFCFCFAHNCFVMCVCVAGRRFNRLQRDEHSFPTLKPFGYKALCAKWLMQCKLHRKFMLCGYLK